jgi:hypothetical protein
MTVPGVVLGQIRNIISMKTRIPGMVSHSGIDPKSRNLAELARALGLGLRRGDDWKNL